MVLSTINIQGPFKGVNEWKSKFNPDINREIKYDFPFTKKLKVPMDSVIVNE